MLGQKHKNIFVRFWCEWPLVVHAKSMIKVSQSTKRGFSQKPSVKLKKIFLFWHRMNPSKAWNVELEACISSACCESFSKEMWGNTIWLKWHYTFLYLPTCISCIFHHQLWLCCLAFAPESTGIWIFYSGIQNSDQKCHRLTKENTIIFLIFNFYSWD